MTGLGPFGALHVINLAARTDRRREMERELARVGAEAAFFPAVRPADPGPFPSRGVRGCFESHLAVLRLIAGGTAEAALILEDDADFTGDLGPGLGSLRDVPWDLVFGLYNGTGSPARAAPGLLRLDPSDEIVTTHFVGVARGAARRLVPYLEAMASRPVGDPRGGPMHVDGAYCWFRRENPDVATLAPPAPWAIQRPSRTDVHALPFADRQPLLRPAMGLARRIKRAWRRRARPGQ